MILHRGILDGRAGWYYAFQRVLAEILLSLHLLKAWRQETAPLAKSLTGISTDSL
ncbi:hypothetical protein [Stenomitos frigidus]|uniref:hypothetical protein n=1 Tax=Stenomitos frigidus TaxID=1886765 RepID=UPI001C631AC6|nr:hypothetical protein [Stenomitos frigidus]